MKCYHCGENEAEYRFFINYMGHMGELRLCGECVESFRQYAQKMFEEFRNSSASALEGWEMGGPMSTFFPMGFPPSARAFAREQGEASIPDDAGDEVRRRRRLNELRELLKSAVDREDYETAAGLRDEITKEILLNKLHNAI